MCGIIAVTGHAAAVPILIDGLARLEYRGYDSAGLALLTADGGLAITRREGKLANLREALADGTPASVAGIAHTRWATHGVPAERNAHPHTDCAGRIGVVHNGIVENHASLREELTARGHRFASETDTEVIAHLIEDAYAGDLAQAVRAALRRTRGAWAVAVVHRDEPGRLVGARLHAPLVIGHGEDETLLASDPLALVARTRQVTWLDDGEVADLRPGHAALSGPGGEPRPDRRERIDWDPAIAERGGYDTYMAKEIAEQPDALRAALEGRVAGDRLLLGELDPLRDAIVAADRVELIGCGSASYAATFAAALIERWAGIPARALTGSEARYAPPPLGPRTLVVAVSQSGETADTLAPLRAARERGAPAFAVTNAPLSAVARAADVAIALRAGPEISVAATKSFTTQVAVLAHLAAGIAAIRGSIAGEALRTLARDLASLPAQAGVALEEARDARRIAARYRSARGFLFVGRGTGVPVALEGALKLKEITYLHAEGYAAGELKHGPIALLDADLPVVAVATRAATADKLLANLAEARARHAPIIAVGTEGDTVVEGIADEAMWVPHAREELAPLLAVIALQRLALESARLRGTDVDQPRNLAKSVTVE